jgi:predicted glycoside hydrolase/deacetylase ChbG (UPF0249 family)
VPGELTIVADDFGMSAAYDRGMLEAAAAGAIDAASVMVTRDPARLADLLDTGIDVGLHLEGNGPEELLDEAQLADQLAAFERLTGRPPDHFDGHHHCHAQDGVASAVADAAVRLGIPVRSVDDEHRSLLRVHGATTPDLLVGRYEEDEPVIPAELAELRRGVDTIEWMVHPGYPDPATGSSYDAGREEDLRALLAYELPAGLRRRRRSRRDAG